VLHGVKIFTIKKNIDERGIFSEILRTDWDDWFKNDTIHQINISTSEPGIIRAWHRHSRGQVDYICVIKGQLKICIYDGDPNSQTKEELNEIITTEENPQVIRVPGYYWHGTKCIGNKRSCTLYFVTRLYNYANPDEERRPWNDPSIINPLTGEPYDWN
jgi:dTDP-4-dehydrorhamnose 3,5-epimerase